MDSFTSSEKFQSSFQFQAHGCEAGLPHGYHLLGLRGWVRVSLFVGVLVEHCIEIAYQIVLEYDLVGQQVREQ
jgi:hypothetical protein